MSDLFKTRKFTQWLDGLGDVRAIAHVLVRVELLAMAEPGGDESVSENVSVLRLDSAFGLRVYFTRKNDSIVLLAGGDRNTQAVDVEQALRLAANV